MKVVVVTGGRAYRKTEVVMAALDHLRPDFVIQGGAQGADSHARFWCNKTDTPCLNWPAKWDEEGRGAGPRRNERMIRIAHKLTDAPILLAFPGDMGTLDCRQRAATAKMEIIEGEGGIGDEA